MSQEPNAHANEPKQDENVGLFWIVVAFVVNVLFWQPMKYLVKNAYRDGGLMRAFGYSFVGAGFSIVMGVLAAYHLGWELGYSALSWVPAGVFACFGSFIYLWCPFLIWVCRPLEKLSDWLWERVRLNSDHKYLPYQWRMQQLEEQQKQQQNKDQNQQDSQPAENKKQEPRHLTWFSHLLVAALYLTGIGGFAYLGWTFSHEFLNAGPEWLSWAVWGFVGLLAFCITGASNWDSRESYRMYRRMKGFAFMTGVLAVYASVPLVENLGLSGWSWAVYLGELIVYCGLVFPALHTLLSEGFYWAYKAVEKMLDTVYDEKDRKYRTFFAQAVNLAVAGSVAFWAYALFANLAWPVWALTLAACASALISYRIVGEILAGGTFFAFIVSSVHISSSIWTYRQDLHELSGLAFADGVWNGISVAAIVLALLANFFLALPAVYIALRFLSRDLLKFAHPVGEGLKLAHDFVDKKFDELHRLLSRCYNEAYVPKQQSENDRNLRRTLLHGLNLAQASVLTGMVVMVALAVHSGILAPVAATVGGALAFAFLYVVCGKLLVEGGVRLVGHIASLSGAVAIGAYIQLSAISGWGWAIGILSWVLLFCLAFPAAYLALAWVLSRSSLLSLLGKTLESFHGRLWGKFLAGWLVVVGIVSTISEKIARAWDKITGKKRQ